jgi:hypothetical protein
MRIQRLISSLAVLVLLGCGGSSLPPDALPNRSGGAFITFGNPEGTESGPDEITLWITDSTFIDEAIQREANGTL